MKSKQKRTRFVVSVLALAGLVAFSVMGYAGSLQPSAPPGPTMKTLDEVEPRVPIHAADLPLTITEPNSYYLVEDINFTSTANHAITIECNNVTIDLMGYTLKGPDSGSTSGIYMNGRTNVEIRNGTVRDFYRGIREYSSASGRRHRIINVRAMSNLHSGIYLHSSGNLIKDCTVAKNGNDGIYAGGGSTVTGNTVCNNGTYGVYAGSGSTVTGNTACNNTGDGIQVSSCCRVTDNMCDDNGYSTGDGAGIYAGGDDNRIERNNITNNDRGVDVDGSGNVIADNMVKANTDNYDIAAGNQLNILLCEVPETIDWPATVTLAGSLTCAVVDADAITVEANDVTIDLAGFTLTGPDSGTGNGIYMHGRSNVEIHNGTVRDFYNGIYEEHAGRQHRIINVRAVSNLYCGIAVLGSGHLVKDCTAAENSGGDGILTGSGCVTGNTVYNNGNYGIYAGGGSRVTDNTAYQNGDDGIYVSNPGCTVTGNTAYENVEDGIRVGFDSTVTGNSTYRNTGDGIEVMYGCMATNNTCHFNGNDGDGAGIHASGTYNRIEQNNVTGNDRGIDVDDSSNLIVKNSATNNGTEYSIVAGNKVGTISTDPTTAGPWDNFDF